MVSGNISGGLELDLRTNLNLTRRVDEVAVGVGGTEEWVKGFINVEVEAWSGIAAWNVSSSGRNRTCGDRICGCVHAGHILLVGDVKEIAEQFNAVFFGHFKAFGQPDVADPVIWLTEGVASDVDSIRASRTVNTAHG